jgi:hypothetical protein
MFIPESPAGLVGFFTFRQTSFAGGASPLKIASQDSNRVAIVFSGTSGGNPRLCTSQSVAAGSAGIILTVGTNITLEFATHGALVNSEWWIPAMAGSVLSVTEVSYRPPRESQ